MLLTLLNKYTFILRYLLQLTDHVLKVVCCRLLVCEKGLKKHWGLYITLTWTVKTLVRLCIRRLIWIFTVPGCIKTPTSWNAAQTPSSVNFSPHLNAIYMYVCVHFSKFLYWKTAIKMTVLRCVLLMGEQTFFPFIIHTTISCVSLCFILF